MRAGIVGQLKGPFQAGTNIFSDFLNGTSQRMKIGVSIDEKDLLPYGKDKPKTDDPNQKYYPNGFAFTISSGGLNSSSVFIRMGRTGKYETDDAVLIGSLVFQNDTPQSVIVNYVTY